MNRNNFSLAILIIGHPGTGKGSLINNIDQVINEQFVRYQPIADTSSAQGAQGTLRYSKYKFGELHKNHPVHMAIFDSVGVPNFETFLDQFIAMLDGKHKLEFTSGSGKKYVTEQDWSDVIDCVILVADKSQAPPTGYTELLDKARQRGIGFFCVATHTDLDPYENFDTTMRSDIRGRCDLIKSVELNTQGHTVRDVAQWKEAIADIVLQAVTSGRGHNIAHKTIWRKIFSSIKTVVRG